MLLMKRGARVGATVISPDSPTSSIFASVIPADAQPYSDVILKVANEQNVDPFIIVALGERESHWGALLDSNGLGDNGHGHGIMQVDDRYFADWLAANAWQDPYTNITKGVQILQDKMRYLAGSGSGTVKIGSSVASRLGVAAGETYPDPRPLTGDDLVHAAIAAYNGGEGAVTQAIAAGGMSAVDRVTTGGNYSADVISTVASLTNSFNSEVAAQA